MTLTVASSFGDLELGISFGNSHVKVAFRQRKGGGCLKVKLEKPACTLKHSNQALENIVPLLYYLDYRVLYVESGDRIPNMDKSTSHAETQALPFSQIELDWKRHVFPKHASRFESLGSAALILRGDKAGVTTWS